MYTHLGEGRCLDRKTMTYESLVVQNTIGGEVLSNQFGPSPYSFTSPETCAKLIAEAGVTNPVGLLYNEIPASLFPDPSLVFPPDSTEILRICAVQISKSDVGRTCAGFPARNPWSHCGGLSERLGEGSITFVAPSLPNPGAPNAGCYRNENYDPSFSPRSKSSKKSSMTEWPATQLDFDFY